MTFGASFGKPMITSLAYARAIKAAKLIILREISKYHFYEGLLSFGYSILEW